jgi:hypothetical protein
MLVCTYMRVHMRSMYVSSPLYLLYVHVRMYTIQIYANYIIYISRNFIHVCMRLLHTLDMNIGICMCTYTQKACDKVCKQSMQTKYANKVCNKVCNNVCNNVRNKVCKTLLIYVHYTHRHVYVHVCIYVHICVWTYTESVYIWSLASSCTASHNCFYYTSKPECAIPDDNHDVHVSCSFLSHTHTQKHACIRAQTHTCRTLCFAANLTIALAAMRPPNMEEWQHDITR